MILVNLHKKFNRFFWRFIFLKYCIKSWFCTRCCKLLPELRRNWSQTGRKCSQRWFIIDAMFGGLCKYFIQVYDEMPTDLQNQMANMEKHVAMYKDQYPLKVVLLKQGCRLLLKKSSLLYYSLKIITSKTLFFFNHPPVKSFSKIFHMLGLFVILSLSLPLWLS